MSEKQQPLSLNQRHIRVLHDLSATRCQPSFDLSPIEQRNPSNADLHGPSKASSEESESSNEGARQFSKIVDSDSLQEEQKPQKVKLAGRRRLCKVSSSEATTDGGSGHVVTEISDFDSPVGNMPITDQSFDKISDFDSPDAVNKCPNGAADEIRDILSDLSSRLDALSIKKVRNVSREEMADQPRNLFSDTGSTQQNNTGFRDKNTCPSSTSSSDSLTELDCQKTDVGRTCVQAKEYETCPSGKSYTENLTCQKMQPNDEASDNMHEKKNGTDVESVFIQSLNKEDNLVLDDNDCSGFTSHEFVQKADKESKTFFKEREDLINVDSCDGNDTDDSSSEVECPFTLAGMKDTYRLPNNIATMLYPHQRDGLKWLWSLHCRGKGGILGDDMGLGKTMQICGFFAGLFHSRLVRRALVVAPKTLLSHWLKELSTAGLSEITREYCGTSAKIREYELQYILQDKGILLTTYDIVRNNSRSLQGKTYSDDDDDEDNITWDYMILDEGHLIKNPTTQRAQSLLEIPSAHRIIISGTPIQNNLKELWALFHFCCPGLLGDKKWFKDKYEYPILRGQDKHASERDKRTGSAVAKDLRDRIQPYFLRRLKSEVFHENKDTGSGNLSKKNEIIVWLKLTACQRQLYEAFLRSELALSSFDGSPLAAITILKKICDHPLLLTKRAAEDVLEGMDSMPNHEDQRMAEEVAMQLADVTGSMNIEDKHYLSCKMTFILTLLDILIPEGHSVLIFSQTRKMLNLIQESLVSEGYDFLRIDGTTKASDRVKIVNEFQEGTGAPIFLLTSQVGGLGLTLTNADRVIVVDPAWNPSTDNQSVDRAYRIGQKKDVVVYRLMTCGTVEEKIYRKQIFKGGLFKSATEHMEHIRYFSQQDLMELFCLPKQGFDVSLTQRQLHEEHDCQHTVDKALGNHIKFLEARGIAGVSHHSLLFSRAAPIQDAQEEIKETVPVARAPFLKHSQDHYAYGSEYAMNPKDVKLHAKNPNSITPTMSSESEIRTRINRLNLLLQNEEMVSNLPDGGKKIQLQITELKSELENIRSKEISRTVIDVDAVATELQQKLNVHTANQSCQ